MDENHVIANGGVKAVINLKGAELCSLQNGDGHEFIWQAGDPWKRHAPNLFPIVGKLDNNRFRHKGKEYVMTQHGFARDALFTWAERTETSCRLSLCETEQTLAIYPFSFNLTIEHAIFENTLTTTYTIANTGDEILPCCIGAHPAFRWPLVDGIPKNAHRLEFSDAETNPLRRISKDSGLIIDGGFSNPVQGDTLLLAEELFIHDAIIMDRPASRYVRFIAPNAAEIKVSWDEGFRELGLWSRPDDANPAHCADFLCIEPWRGMASPADFKGEITEKPGIMLIPVGEKRQASFTISITS